LRLRFIQCDSMESSSTPTLALDRPPRTPLYAPPDTAAIKDLLAMMKNTIATLGQTFETLGEQSAKVATLGPSLDNTQQIQALRRQMRHQDRRQDARIEEVKHVVKNVLKDQIADEMRPQIGDHVRQEIAMQVREQVSAQLKEHMPISLEEQAADSKKQLAEVRNSLTNSEARRANSTLRSHNLDDPLEEILKTDGSRSELFPQDLKTLFTYDSARARALVRDFGLTEHESRERNLNRFMAHIGIPFHLIPVPIMLEPGPSGNALGITLA